MGIKPPSHQNPGRQTEIVDEGGLHKFRTEIPNTVIRGLKSREPRKNKGLSVYAKWLYVYFKSVAGDHGTFYRNTTTIALEAGMSRGQVSAAKKELVEHDLITVKNGKNPKRDVDRIRIKDIWLANMQEFSVHIVNTDDEEDVKTPQEDETPSIHNMNTENVQSSQYEHQSSQYEHMSGFDKHPSGSERENSILTNNDAAKSMQSSPHELGVHNMNQRRSHEEENPKKRPPSISPPRGEHPEALAEGFCVLTPEVRNLQSEVTAERNAGKPPKKQRASKPPALTRCPPGHLFDASLRQWAGEKYPAVNFDEAVEALRDWEFKTPRSDWDACLRTWIRTEAKRITNPVRARASPPLTRAEQRAAAEEQSNRELEDLVLGRDTHNSVWAPPRRDGADLQQEPQHGRQSGILDGRGRPPV